MRITNRSVSVNLSHKLLRHQLCIQPDIDLKIDFQIYEDSFLKTLDLVSSCFGKVYNYLYFSILLCASDCSCSLWSKETSDPTKLELQALESHLT